MKDDFKHQKYSEYAVEWLDDADDIIASDYYTTKQEAITASMRDIKDAVVVQVSRVQSTGSEADGILDRKHDEPCYVRLVSKQHKEIT